MTTNTPARQGINGLLERVDASKNRLAAFLPPGTDVDRFVALARREIAEQPQLANCDANSVMRAISNCASSGLPLDGQFSSLIIRKSKHGKPTATWDPTYRGMISLAMSSGFVSDVQAFAVTEHDTFEVELGTEPKIKHVPALLKGGALVAAYAWARLSSGRLVIEVVGREDLTKIKAASPAGSKGPWGKWESQMARKSAIRRLLKKLPAAPLQAVLAHSRNASPVVPSVPDGFSGDVIDSDAHEPPPALPEDENRLECQALERLRGAANYHQLQAAWAQCQIDHNQSGLDVPQAVRQVYDELLESMKPTNATDSEWLDEYENG